MALELQPKFQIKKSILILFFKTKLTSKNFEIIAKSYDMDNLTKELVNQARDVMNGTKPLCTGTLPDKIIEQFGFSRTRKLIRKGNEWFVEPKEGHEDGYDLLVIGLVSGLSGIMAEAFL